MNRYESQLLADLDRMRARARRQPAAAAQRAATRQRRRISGQTWQAHMPASKARAAAERLFLPSARRDVTQDGVAADGRANGRER